MCALNCPAWSLQNSLVASVELSNDEYTAMICRLVHLAGCFYPTTNAYQGTPHPKMVDRNIQLWMRSRSDFPEEEEQALSSMVAFVNRCYGSLVHHFVLMVPLERRKILEKRIPVLHTRGKSVWSQEFVADEIACLGMTEKIRAQVVDAAVARSDAWEFLSRK
eukprot:scaffold171651_cov63-Attheya_sp.AAC.1